MSCISCLLIPHSCRVAAVCSTPWVTSSSWTVKEQCSVLIRLLHLLAKLTISVYKSILSLISSLDFLLSYASEVLCHYHFMQSRGAEPFLLKWFWIKAIHTCLLIFVSHLLLSFPCYLVLLSPVGLFDLFVSWWCMRSSVEELSWTTNNLILFYVKQASLAAGLHSTVDDLLQQYERATKMLRALQQWGRVALSNQCNNINKHYYQGNDLQKDHLVSIIFSLNCLNCTSYLSVASSVLRREVCNTS